MMCDYLMKGENPLEIISNYDGLLLVHPEWHAYPGVKALEGIEEVYNNFRTAQEACKFYNIPFMVSLDEWYLRMDYPIINLGLKPGYIIVETPNLVEDISRAIGKSPEDISLLFGGFNADECVRDWVSKLCYEIEVSDKNLTETDILRINNNHWWKKPEKFGKGTVYYDLTDRLLFPDGNRRYSKNKNGLL